MGFDVVGFEGVDDGLFEGADVGVDAELGGVEVDDGVGDELSWAVVGDIAAAIGLVEFDAVFGELGFGGGDMGGGLWSSGDGDDGWVLDHQDAAELGFGGFAGVEDVGVVLLLELVGLVVAEVLEGDEGEGGRAGGGWRHGGW